MSHEKSLPEAADPAQGVGAAETGSAIEQLEVVIQEARQQKKWSAPLNKRAEELFTEVLRREPMDTVVLVGSELHINVFETVLQKNWGRLKPEDKEEFVRELCKANTEKGMPKQIAAADKIARSGEAEDRSLAAELLYTFVGGAGKDGAASPKLPKYKTEALQKRFLLGPAGWPNPETEDDEKMKALLSAFIEAADPKLVSGAKSRISLYGFAKWAGRITSRLPQSDPTREVIIQRVLAIGVELPEWGSQVERAAGRQGQKQDAPADTAQAKSETEQGAVGQVKSAREDEFQRPVAPVAEKLKTDSVEMPTATAKQQVPSQKDDAQSAQPQPHTPANPADVLRSGLGAISAGLDFIEELKRTLSELRTERELLVTRLDQAERRAEDLRNRSEGLEKSLAEVTRQYNTAQGLVSTLREKVGGLAVQLEEERSGRVEDEKRFSEQIEREKQVALNGFKGKLRVVLHHIFDNKRTTDDQELSPELAGFYRSWFNEVEEKLKASGVQLD
jgi:hypothetical protein